MDTRKELEGLGFRRVGCIRPDPDRSCCRAEIDADATGFVVYAHVVGSEIKKFGITTPRLSARVGQNVSTINAVIALQDGRAVRDAGWHHRPFDSFKRLAPEVIRAGLEIELWAQVCESLGSMMQKEAELNDKYRPEWTKEAKRHTRRG